MNRIAPVPSVASGPRKMGGQAVAEGPGPREEVQHVIEVEIAGQQCEQQPYHPEGAMQALPQLFCAHDLDGAHLDGPDPGPVALLQRRTDQAQGPPREPEHQREEEGGGQCPRGVGPEDTPLAVVAVFLYGFCNAGPVYLGQDRATDAFEPSIGIDDREQALPGSDDFASQWCFLDC